MQTTEQSHQLKISFEEMRKAERDTSAGRTACHMALFAFRKME